MNWQEVHPKARPHFQRLEEECLRAHLAGSAKSQFVPFEGFRHPRRQEILRGSERTKEAPWDSPHQYGLALDFPAFDDLAWNYDTAHDWAFLMRTAIQMGLLIPDEDRPWHVVHPLWIRVRFYLT